MDASRFNNPYQLKGYGSTFPISRPLFQPLRTMVLEEQKNTLSLLSQLISCGVNIIGIDNFTQIMREVIQDPVAEQAENYRTNSVLTKMGIYSHSGASHITTLSQLSVHRLWTLIFPNSMSQENMNYRFFLISLQN
jgi:hypothetical protein